MKREEFSDVFAIRVREDLEKQKKLRVPFERAWAATTRRYRRPEAWVHCMAFLKEHMRAAYNNAPFGGRLDIDPPEAKDPAPRPVDDGPAMCRSGEGCNELATRGRFGLTFCDKHGAQLEALVLERGYVRTIKRRKAA